METKHDPAEEDSFIVLGTPGASLAVNGIDHYYDTSLNDLQLDDALKDLSDEASIAFKAHFKSGDGPSPASLMAASTIVTDDKSTEDLQKRFGEILDENVILKETLKQSNESMKEQFLLIASCQEDMMKTHLVHREKFDETRELIEKLRQDNKTLKQDIVRLMDGEAQSAKSSSDTKSGPSSALEFVTSPDDDTVNKLTAQLELVEKQRRQVIVDNEKLTWQKESLERIVDASSKERDELKQKIQTLENQVESVNKDYTQKINHLNITIQELNSKIQSMSQPKTTTEDLIARDAVIQNLESKIHNLQGELKTAQLKILELKTVELEYSKHKSGTSDTVKLYKDQVQELNNRLREAQTTMFQPARVTMNSETESMTSGEFGSLISNVKLYDKTLKHLAELLNMLTNGASDSLSLTHAATASLLSMRLERGSAEAVRSALTELHDSLGQLHSSALANGSQVKNMMKIFEGIFKDYNELLKKSVVKQENPPAPITADVEALTGALLARDTELQSLRAELNAATSRKDDIELLKAQADLYKMDFEAEREAREKMACEKDNMHTDLRMAQRRIQELTLQLEEVRILNPNIFRSATSKRLPAYTTSATTTAARRASTVTGNMVYTCPKCNRFSSDQYKVMEDHFDFCLDDL